jgi:tRNA G18 (ribose-2'-O)-methylase SpoU
VPSVLKVSVRNARFQQWQALHTNRTKRNQLGQFLVQGVRPITLAVEHGWPIRVLLRSADGKRSGWAEQVLRRVGTSAEIVDVAPALLAELGDKEDDAPELIAVADLPADDLDRMLPVKDALLVAFDRPGNPGNVGTLIRSADAFGARGVIVTGHAADPYDPRAVRASTGSLFGVPVVRAPSHREVLAWLEKLRSHGTTTRVVGTDEAGSVDIDAYDFTGPTLLVVGNETRGMSAAWRDACDTIVRIPIGGAASSLNAAVAASVTLYEAARQRRAR